MTAGLSPQVERARQGFGDRNPNSRRYFERAREVLPGGHTRTVLTHPPFPLVFVSGEGATLTDADGHQYIDLLGDYTAGLLGHSERRVLDSVARALSTNASVGGIHPAEEALARLMCERFGLERVRFTNSGTEANLMAITTARQVRGRSKVMVFQGGYHGGLLYFSSGAAPWNAPYDFVIGPYNDREATLGLIREHGPDLAALLVEPMLGAGGCIPGAIDFLESAFDAAREAGAVVIADEVMTSRHGHAGMANLLGIQADLTTYGKYIGGGFSFGAFGGSAALMDQYDTSPSIGRTNVISHAGTFNNNLATMTAGTVVLGEVFTPAVAVEHTARGNEFRKLVSTVLAGSGLGVTVTGFGSMMSLHARTPAPNNAGQAADRDEALQELIFLGLLERGIYTAPRGMINLSLAHTDDHLAEGLEALADCLQGIGG
ncbi:MAG TPA: aminotransferase class III-fold pyridoxal phosphate-dependent enzyme [Acidimicrobiia bacterium]|nr:aminotransferase class III-fold pyridoxal phosphate-dependent enzyme [Acidimicrobiia bacterium]